VYDTKETMRHLVQGHLDEQDQRLSVPFTTRNAAIERLGAYFDEVLRSWRPSAVRGEERRARNTAMYSLLPAEWDGVRTALSDRLGQSEGA
jgi:hypothetical protein